MSTTKELWHDARHPPADPATLGLSFKDKAVLVTGASGWGLGYNAAVKYAALGANPLILAVRTQEKGESTKQSIVAATGCSPDIFIIETVDLASFASVRDFVDRIVKRAPRLHVVQLAGGVAPWAYAKTQDGFETGLQVDVLSTTLLPLLLLPKLRETATASPEADGYLPHVSFLCSIAIFIIPDGVVPKAGSGQTLIQRCDDEAKWDPINQYFLIKLATWYAVKGVADLVTKEYGGKVVVNATCPGLCKTNMVRDLPWIYRAFMVIRHALLGRTAEQGSRTLVSATGLGPESHGKFWNNDRYHPLGKFLESEESDKLYRETWGELLSIVRKHVPEGTI